MWCMPPATIRLERDDVQVWRARVDLTRAELQNYFRVLTEDERARAVRFCFARDRAWFIATRGILRNLLARYRDCDPAELQFEYNAYGKPALRQNQDDAAIEFNVSHSHGLALYAITRARAVGIDLEWINPARAELAIAERFFSPREVACLRALPRAWQIPAFFDCWTRKEAFVKARGLGLSLPLNAFDVSLAPGEPAMLLHVNGDPRAARDWSLYALSPAPDFAAALAIPGKDCQIECWDWRHAQS